MPDSDKDQIHSRLQKLAARSAVTQSESLPIPSDTAPIAVPPSEEPAAVNPFLAKPTDKPLVAICGKRNGYVMVAASHETLRYDDLPDDVLVAALAWAITLEGLGAEKVYWMTLSEVTPHLHIHLFPRWPEDTLKGIPLFESRDTSPQPAWADTIRAALSQWAADYEIELV